MKKLLLLPLILCIGLMTASGQVNKEALDTKNGFRDAKFGMPFSAFKAMKLIGSAEGGDKRTYKRVTDALTIGKYHLSSISYGFYKGKLLEISIDTPDYDETQGVKKAFQSLYGDGEDSEVTVDYWLWVSDKVWLSLDDSAYGGAGHFHMFGREMEEFEKSEEEKKAAKAKGDL